MSDVVNPRTVTYKVTPHEWVDPRPQSQPDLTDDLRPQPVMSRMSPATPNNRALARFVRANSPPPVSRCRECNRQNCDAHV